MKRFNSRIANLGTETAFAVSGDAANWAAKGNKVYPFHLGDMDIITPENIIEAAHKAMLDKKTGYVPAAGVPALRQTVAEHVGNTRGVKYEMENVAIQPGGKPVIGKFLNAVLNFGDGVLYPNPGYPIYESQINYLGGTALPYGYIETENGFRIDRAQVEAQINEHTRIFIYNNFQNPIGAESDEDEMQWVARLAKKHNMLVLSDEAYFNIRYSGNSSSIVAIDGMQERTVILFTFSKTYAMTGWRLGAAIGPKYIIDIIGKLNVNDESCTNNFVQHAGIEAINGDQSGASDIVAELKGRRDALIASLLKIDGVTTDTPETTFYLFPNITKVYERMGFKTLEEFRLETLYKTGVSFCTREHFGTAIPGETQQFIRFAYSGIPVDQIEEGCAKLKEYWER